MRETTNNGLEADISRQCIVNHIHVKVESGGALYMGDNCVFVNTTGKTVSFDVKTCPSGSQEAGKTSFKMVIIEDGVVKTEVMKRPPTDPQEVEPTKEENEPTREATPPASEDTPPVKEEYPDREEIMKSEEVQLALSKVLRRPPTGSRERPPADLQEVEPTKEEIEPPSEDTAPPGGEQARAEAELRLARYVRDGDRRAKLIKTLFYVMTAHDFAFMAVASLCDLPNVTKDIVVKRKFFMTLLPFAPLFTEGRTESNIRVQINKMLERNKADWNPPPRIR